MPITLEASPRMPGTLPVIDLHCHAAGIGAGGSGCYVNPRLIRNPRFGFYLRAFGVSRRDLSEAGDALVLERISQKLAASTRVDQAVVLALDGVVDRRGRLDEQRTEVLVPDEFVARTVARFPNLLLGASVHPLRPDALERLDRAKHLGAVLVKWLPAIQDFDPADRRFIPFYERLAELGLPLLSHTGSEHSFTRASDEVSDPEHLRLPLSVGVTVIAAHAGSSGTYEGEPSRQRLARLMREFPHCYADISALTLVNRTGQLASTLATEEFRGRLLYGTDYPLVTVPLLTTPWASLPALGLRTTRSIAAIANPWDRDVAFKEALGMGRKILERPARVLGLAPDACAAPVHETRAAALRPST